METGLTIFERERNQIFAELGDHIKMVLSTSYQDQVTSRMMSVLLIEEKFYFQTDCEMRKYQQLQKNPNVAFCTHNIQIEGICKEVGRPSENETFCQLYQRYFSNSYAMYTNIEKERLFAVSPAYIQIWVYENGKPFVKTLDFERRLYEKKAYGI